MSSMTTTENTTKNSNTNINSSCSNSNNRTNDSIVEIQLRRILNANEESTFESANFRERFLEQFNHDECSLETFAINFFNEVRNRVYVHLRSTESVGDEKTNEREKEPIESSLRVNSFPELPTPGGAREFTQITIRNSSTPTRKSLNPNSPKHTQTPRRSVDNGSSRNICTTPAKNNSLDRSRNSTADNSSIGSSSFCLGDFLTSPTVSSSRHSSAPKKKTAQHNTSFTSNNSSNNTKPKKRVVPITIGKTPTAAMGTACISPNSCGVAAFGASSSFSQENNIQQLSNTEAEMKDFNQRSVAEARKALKQDLSEVSSVIKASAVADLTQSMPKLHIKSTEIIYDETATRSIANALEKIPKTTTAQLKMLASIFGLLLDMNLTINVLQEISLLLNLLNANVPVEKHNTESYTDLTQKNSQKKNTTAKDQNILHCLLKEVINCIFFALSVLEDQQHTLALIDTKSLGVVLQCERLICLSPSLSSSLNAVYTQKQSFANSSHYASWMLSMSGLKNVCFQEDTDSRKFFYNNSEFGAFKTQRDIFYNTLKHWEKHHLYPTWKFTLELAPKVREIFRQSENPINMIHFAKLFVSQLLISANEHASPEEFGIGMDDVDLKKFTKLSQRLVAPSNFSVNYQFPSEQAFFRDFIIESRSVPFMEHLKMVLFSELATLNDSTFEELNSVTNSNNFETNYEENEFIVRPHVLSSMLILAKFLGFVSALPFQVGQTQTTAIQDEQLCLRRLFQPAVNICQILETAIQNGRHLITLPWIVQYLAMLDDVTLQLDNHVETVHKLYGLCAALGNGELQITPTSAFIVRCCLGWLFEQKRSIGDGYLNYRIAAVTHGREANSRSIKTMDTEEKIQNSIIKFAAAKADLQLKPILDTILSVACPFLAEFRVSIMPSKHAMTKNVSRSGRFRHITPCIAETTTPTSTPRGNMSSNVLGQPPPNSIDAESESGGSLAKRQKLLMESFLHSQNSSIRRLIVFLSERVYKCVVKDAQYRILLPSKEDADNEINKITISSDAQQVRAQVTAIYESAHSEANKKWNEEIPKMIKDRINRGLDALLPIETTPILKRAYACRIKCDASVKIEQWRHMNFYKEDFYCSNINDLTSKICQANNANHSMQCNYQTTELVLIQSQPRISDLIEELQYWLYTTGFQTSFQPEKWPANASSSLQRDAALIAFLERLKSSFVNTLPTIYYRLIGAGLIQILQHMIAVTPSHVSAELIEACCEFFLDSKICIADVASSSNAKECKTPKSSVEGGDDHERGRLNASTSSTSSPPQETTTIYQALITASFLQSLGSCLLSYEKLKELLNALIQAGVVTMGFVNDLFMTAFKADLDVSVFNAISEMLYELAQQAGANSSNVPDLDDDADCESELKSHLLMEVLADFSRNLDDF